MNRRRFLGSVAMLPATMMAVRNAKARMFRGGGAALEGGGGEQVTLATMTLVNTSGSTQAADFVTPMFGHVFKKGGVPNGTYPAFVPSGGSAASYTMWSMSTWNDGSLRRAGFMFRCGVSIAGSGTLAVAVKNYGSAPGTSSRATSDLTARDLKVLLTGITNLSGAWESSLNTAITDATEIKVIADGGAGKVWRIRAPFKQTGAAHGQLEGYWYVAAIQDASAGLYRIRCIPRIIQPWLDIDSPAKLKRGFSGTVQDGATVLQTLTPNAAKSFTSTNDNITIAMTGHGLETGMGGWMTTPPTGFSTNTDYYVRVASANSLQFHPTAIDAVLNSNVITPTSSTTGTFTPHVELVHFASAWGCGTDGKWLSIQGEGSAVSEPTVRIQHDKTYWRSTKAMGVAYDLTVTTPTAADSVSYTPNGHGVLVVDQNNTGGRPEIGVQPSWVAQHFLLQDAVSDQSVRVHALSLSHLAMGLRRNSTGTLPVVNNSTYTGMGSANSTMRWGPGTTSGFTAPAGDLDGVFQSSVSHWPSCMHYAALVTGEPQYDDLLAEVGNYMVLQKAAGERNPTNGGVTRYGCLYQDPSQARTDAWTSRELSLCFSLPDSHWDVAALKTYLTDMAAASFASINAYNADQDAFWNDSGIYHFRTDDATGAPWQHSFMIHSAAIGYAVSELASALTFLNHLIKFPGAVAADIGIYHYTAYTTRMRQTDSGAGALVSAMSQIHWSPAGGFSATATASSDEVSLVVSNAQLTLAADDKLLYMFGSPTGLIPMTSYFARDVTDPGVTSNKTAKAALTSGGAAVDITADGSQGSILCLRLANIPAGGTGLDYASTGGYTALARAAFRAAQAAGATMPGTIRSDMDTIFNSAGVSFDGSDPKDAMDVSY